MEGQKITTQHCIKDTRGANIHHDIYKCIKDLKAQKVIVKVFEKTTFASKELIQYLSCLCGRNDIVEFCGVCTDICVISNVLATRTELPNTKIVVDFDCCAGSSVDANNAAMWIFDSCNVEIESEM